MKQGLAGQASMFGIVTDHAASKQKTVMQGWVAEYPFGPPAG
jgi:hypothetical protein